MRIFKSVTVGALALAGLCCLWSSGVAADEEEGERRVKREIRVRTAAGEGKYWLGVGLGEVSDALKSHLDLQGGVIVQHVVPDSPADKAGIKAHDILLKFGEQDLGRMQDLLKSVRQNEDQKSRLTVLRKGRKQTLEITPGERPEGDIVLNVPESGRDLRVVIDKWLEKNKDGEARGPLRFRFFGPGIFTGEHEIKLPQISGNLSVSINKQDDSPSKIVVKHEDKTWEITEDELDELPADIQAHVQRMLGRGSGVTPLRLKAFRTSDTDINIDADTVKKWVGRAQGLPQQLEHFHDMKKSFEEMRRNFDAGSLKELRREIESLRREVEKLRGSPSDKQNDA